MEKKLRKKSNYYFDVEFCQESISGIHKCKLFRAAGFADLILEVLGPFMTYKSCGDAREA